MTKKTRLAGKELLAKLSTIKGLNRREQARQCGYVSVNERVQQSQFLEAIAIARGVIDKLPDGRGKRPNYITTVHANGTVVIGDSYIKEMGFEAGDRLEIKLGYKHIKLVRISDLEDVEVKDIGENP
jgi:hypothetical protein